jgi:hypothetical protein
MNNGNISDAGDLGFTDPATDGISITGGTLFADNIMGETLENSMTVGAAILFPVISDDADEVDAFAFPQLAGAPTATPSDGGEGHAVWDSTNDSLYVWDGAAWKDMGIADDAQQVTNTYTADEALAIRDFVYISAADNVSKALGDAEATARVIGCCEAAAADTESVNVICCGVVDGFTGLTAGSRYFLDASTAGSYTSTRPSGSGNIVVQLGYAKSTTAMHLHIEQIGKVR